MDNIIINQQDFFMKEIEYLRNGIDDAIKETRSIERYSLLATGVIWSWCATAQGNAGLKIIVWIPCVITLLLGIRSLGISKEISTIDRYLERVEGMVGLPGGFGWERNQAEKRSPFEVKTAYLFWSVLQVGTIVIALLYFFGVLKIGMKS